MTLVLPTLYHWSPERCRKNIRKRGLRPTTPTAVWMRPQHIDGVKPGHGYVLSGEDGLRAVCLGTSPSTAGALSGALHAEPGTSWDLWEVALSPDDEVHYRPGYGADLDEVRVVNRIPKRQVWMVGSRVVGVRRMSHA